MITEHQTLIILTPGFAKSESDSTCLPMQQNLVLALKHSFPQLNIVILSFQYPYEKKQYTWHGIQVISFNGQNKGGLPKLLLRNKINTALNTIHNRTPINWLLSFWYGECAFVAEKFAQQKNLKHFCWILGQDAKATNTFPASIKLKAGQLIALSDFIQESFERNFGVRPSHIIPPGINTSEFNPSLPKKDIDIVAAGSLIPLKQYGIFIEMIVSLKNQLPGIKCLLIGDGPERDKLRSVVAENDLTQSIQLTGELSHEETLQQMQRSKIFLHPSSYEAFGVVCVEALYAGCHVISFCRPMQQPIQHWHIATSKQEMLKFTMDILPCKNTDYSRITFLTIEDVAQKMMELFSNAIIKW